MGQGRGAVNFGFDEPIHLQWLACYKSVKQVINKVHVRAVKNDVFHHADASVFDNTQSTGTLFRVQIIIFENFVSPLAKYFFFLLLEAHPQGRSETYNSKLCICHCTTTRMATLLKKLEIIFSKLVKDQ